MKALPYTKIPSPTLHLAGAETNELPPDKPLMSEDGHYLYLQDDE